MVIFSSEHNLETVKKKSKAGSKIKFTPKYLTKANSGYLQDTYKNLNDKKSVESDLWREAFRTGMWAI